MSVQAKLFITLCKQTVSWTACWRRGVGWCVRSVRAASDAAAWPPSLLLLSLLLCSVLITPQTRAPGPSDYTQSCRRAPMSSFQTSMTFPPRFSPFRFHLKLSPVQHRSSLVEAAIYVCLVFVCLWVACGEAGVGNGVGVGGLSAVVSGLWEAGGWASLTNSIAQAA